ncbi:MAG: hypothetical protein JWO53_850 [Chlamydiia bacterium]|nr:hypothetical protein [Chlamydiia bacterium]
MIIGSDTTSITLNARMDSKLNWQKEQELVSLLREKNQKIIYFLDLGLFSELTQPLIHEAQFQALLLAIDHFVETFISPYEDCLAEVILCKESLPFHLSTSDPILDRNQAADYLQLLVDHLPEEVIPYAILDASTLQDPLLVAQLTAKDSFCNGRLELIILNSPFPILSEPPATAVLLPRLTVTTKDAYQGLREEIERLISQKIPFKVISEDFLSIEWEGIDTLIVQEKGISLEGRRKLQGFTAAGGEICYQN